MNLQFWKFLVCGGLAAAANVMSRSALSNPFSYSTAIVLAYLIGMATAFVLNRLFVFPSPTRPLHHQLLLFTVINLLAIAQTLAISLVLARLLFPWLGVTYHPELLAHVAGVLAPVATSFLGHKRFTFSSKQEIKG